MAGLTPNSTNIDRVSASANRTAHLVVHPEYTYWKPEWVKLRDCISGQREIKRKREVYLKAMKGADDDDYAIYLERATFYNMTSQTLNGMLGQVFRRDPVIRGLPGKFKDAVTHLAKDGTSHVGFTKTVMGEQIGIGRFGVLVDAPAVVTKDTPASYVVGYAAENIIDWRVETVDGQVQPVRVLLREFEREQTSGPTRDNPWMGSNGGTLTSAQARKNRRDAEAARKAGKAVPLAPNRLTDGYSYTTIYRELTLVPDPDGGSMYVQNVYRDDPCGQPTATYTPTVRGKRLNFIPFKMFGAASNSMDCEKPPLLDIADLNLSHYRTYAELEYGRLFTALPVYYAPGTDADGAAEYHIGPNTVWEVPQGSEPGILEYKGTGLGALEKALADKERQIAAIGGRLMPGSSKSVSESNNQTTLREANEQSLLLNVIQAAQDGMRMVLRWWLMWRDVALASTENLRYEINQDFLSTPIGAREIRAIQMLYQDGFIPVDVLFEYFRKAELIPSSMALEEFKAMLNDPDSFINNPDAQARQRGFADRGQELQQAQIAREVDMERERLALEERSTVVEEDKLEIAREVGSTSVSATRKLGDPEQAAPAQADQGLLKVQQQTADTAAQAQKDQAKAAMVAAKTPKVVAPPAPAGGRPKPKPAQ